MSVTRDIATDPPGADVYFKSYAAMDVDWVHLGSTPLANARVPSAVLRWKFENEGFETVELITGSVPSSLALRENGTTSDGMVTIPAGGLGVTLAGLGGQTHPAGAYLMSKYEVTNAEYTVFVDAGGYTTTRFWTHAFVRGGEVIPWEDAMAEFQDRTGRLGPATWEVGTYPEGEEDYPVRGVSWYEAAAFAEFSGKTLPTIYHWTQAAGLELAGYVTPLSNFGGEGRYAGVSRLGHSDGQRRETVGGLLGGTVG